MAIPEVKQLYDQVPVETPVYIGRDSTFGVPKGGDGRPTGRAASR
jgi:hypothetical protein